MSIHEGSPDNYPYAAAEMTKRSNNRRPPCRPARLICAILLLSFAILQAQDNDEWSVLEAKKAQQAEKERRQSREYAEERAHEEMTALLPPEQTARSFTLVDGYRADLYASEVDFPIGSPVAMTFDNRGRLWVATSPTYPHLLPGERPRDAIVILEDTDRDGRADKHTVFADDLYLPMGIAWSGSGLYVSQQPNLLFLRDSDGDDVADDREILLHGFGTADSHHVISAFEWGPGGGLYLNEGFFLHSQVETPWGPRRLHDGGVWRFEPRRQRLEVHSSYRFTNPWGYAFDYWGEDILCDASSSRNYYMAYFSAREMPYPVPGKFEDDSLAELAFNVRGRPSAGCDFISSSQFPERDQGRFITTQVIGFHGIRWNHFRDHGAGWAGIETEQDLLQSSDPSFRPVALEFGPDGALYVLDFYNPIVGHMQYSLRDPRRDKTHGRIWRITARDRPLRWQPEIAGAGVEQLLRLLQDKENRVRFHARRRLQEMDGAGVVPALERWLAQLDDQSPGYEHHLLEGLWVYQGLDIINKPLLEKLLRAKQFNARAAAARVLRFWLPHYADPLPLLRQLVADEHPRVRLQGIIIASFIPSADAAGIALSAATREMDSGMESALSHTLQVLSPYGQPVIAGGSEEDAETMLSRLLKVMSDQGLLAGVITEPVAAELLSRASLNDKQRERILVSLANLREQSTLETALDLYAALPPDSPSVHALAWPIISADTETLSAYRQQLETLVKQTEGARRQTASAALAKLHNDVGPVISLAGQTAGGLADVFAAAPLLEAELRTALQEIAAQYLRTQEKADIRTIRSALSAVAENRFPETRELVASYNRGAELYTAYCSACHLPTGLGVSGAFPPLANADWLQRPNAHLIKVVMHGLTGPIRVNGVDYRSVMAPLGGVLDNRQIADALTYVRHAWNNPGGRVSVPEVETVRQAYAGRRDAWTLEELQQGN